MRRSSLVLVPLAALAAVLPLLTGGHSCGADSRFHLQSWLGAADQLRHGVLLPRWLFLAAYNAGEPRFIFYPPLSWMLGALLTLVLPFQLVPPAVTFVILCIAGFSMVRFARTCAPTPVALLAACVFLANPFMLWAVTGRNAYAELLAAAVCPLLLAALLDPRPSPWRLGLPLALMWLSNVPGGVIGTYVFLFVATVQLARRLFPTPHTLASSRWRSAAPLATIYAGGFVYGLALAAFFLLPAIFERRYIQLAAALLPPLRPIDNLFLHRMLLPQRDAFLIRTAHIAVVMAAVTCVGLLVAGWHSKRKGASARAVWRTAGVPAAALTAALLFSITFLAAPLWRTLPAVSLVQFPWRSLFVLGVCMSLAIALALRETRMRALPASLAGLAFAAVFAHIFIARTRVSCQGDLDPTTLKRLIDRNHTLDPIDEYVVATGSADFLRPDNPPFWLAAHPSDYAPGTTPNPAETDPAAEWPMTPDDAQLRRTALHFTVTAPAPTYLVVNLQDYPNWRITRNGSDALPHLRRPDGLLTVALPAGASTLTISWRHTWDEWLGGTISLFALLAFLLTRRPMRALLFLRTAEPGKPATTN